jgi:hypothetical protein
MTEETTKPTLLLAVFEDIEPAAHGVEKLTKLGVQNDHITVISGTPITEKMLGRPQQDSNVPRIAMGGAVVGFALGIFLAFGTPAMYPISVGGQGLFPFPPAVVVIFEMTMLSMLISTFVAVFLDSRFPSYTPKEYVPEISDGRIAIFFECPPGKEKEFTIAMAEAGAESVNPAEAQEL